MMNNRERDDFLFDHVNDTRFCEWFMNEIQSEVVDAYYDDDHFGGLSLAQLGRLLIKGLLQNDAYAILDAIAAWWSDIEFVKSMYEDEFRCNDKESD